jgi:acyl-coenzyme A synthetase/AMP-(fatty) acid ligase
MIGDQATNQGSLSVTFTSFVTAGMIGFNVMNGSTADVGWVTGHSNIVYAPLMHGVTGIMYDGTPDYPK